MKCRCALLLALFCSTAGAGSPNSPPPAAPAAEENPAVDTMQSPPEDAAGTTIVGERDAALGLYLTPWKEEQADNIDPPPSLLDEPPQPLDARGFALQTQDAATISAYRRELRLPNR